MNSEDSLQQPGAADHRPPVHRQHSRHRENTTPRFRIMLDLDSLIRDTLHFNALLLPVGRHLLPVHRVKLRGVDVDEGDLRINQLQEGTVFTEKVIHEIQRLGNERVRHRRVVGDSFNAIEREPLHRKILREISRSRIIEETFDLPLENCRLSEFSRFCKA